MGFRVSPGNSMDVATEAKLAQISKDVNSLTKLNDTFSDHAREDAKHFGEMNEKFDKIDRTLQRIENKLDPEHEDYLLGPLEKRLTPIFEIHDGGVALRKLIVGSSVIALALAAIGGTVIAAINWIRHG